MKRDDYLKRIKNEYGIDVSEFMKLFYLGLSQRDLSTYFNISRKVIRKIGEVLNLNWKDRTNPLIRKEVAQLDRTVERLKYKNMILSKKYKKVIQKDVIFEEWISKLIEFLYSDTEVFNVFYSKYGLNNEPYIKSSKSEIYSKHVLLLSDWHIGQKVDPSQVHNTYNLSEAEKILQHIIYSINDYKNKNFSDEIYIFILGDLIESGIHDDLLSDEKNIFEYIFWVVDYLLYMIHELQQCGYKKVNVRATVGNHGRLKKVKYYKNKYVTLDAFIYGFIERLLSNSTTVTFSFCKENIGLENINNHFLAYLHGDILNSFNEANIDKLQSQIYYMFKQNANTILLGHFHTPKILKNNWNGYTIINGSLIGIDEYATFNNLRLQKRTQIIFSIDDKPNNFSFLL